MSIEDIDTQYHLDHVPYPQTTTSPVGPIDTYLAQLGANDANLETFLNQYVIGSTGGERATDFYSFDRLFRQHIGAPATTDPMGDFQPGYHLFTNYYESQRVQFNSIAANIGLSDWQMLAGSDAIDTTNDTTWNASLKALFNKSFGAFLAHWTSDPDPDNIGGSTLNKFENSSSGYVRFISPPSGVITNNLGLINDYQRLFFGFFPGATQADFENHLAYFVDKSIQDTGYFNTTHHIERWTDHLRLVAGPNTLLTNLTPLLLELDPAQITKLNQTRILLEVFALITQMIGTIQKVAVAQAQRLQFLGKWQKAFSDIMADMPTFTKNDGSVIGGGIRSWAPDGINDPTGHVDSQLAKSSEGKDARTDLNQDNNAILEKLRTERQIVTDEAKQFQTNVNQTNDAASAQSNIATAIIQQLSGILATIFR